MSLTDVGTRQDYRSTRGRVPVFRPLLNGETFEVTITQATVEVAERKHDTASLSCVSSALENTDGILDSPISFFYGQAPRTELFTGYVVDVTESQSGEGALTFDLSVLGPTKVMQYTTPRYWTRKSIPSVIENLAYLNGLGFYGHSHSTLWASLAQAERSDWATVLSMADRLGWSVFNRYGIVMCYDPIKLFTDSGPYARLVPSQDQEYKPESDRRLIEFNPTEVSDEHPNRMGAQIAYFSPKGKVQVAKQPGTFERYRFYSDQPIRNHEDAMVILNSVGIRTNSWKQVADARIWGDADMLPGMTIDVVNTSPRYAPTKFSGRWLVRGVKHIMDRQQYQTQMALSRPDPKANVKNDPYTSFWNQAQRSKPTLNLTDGKWVSSWTNPNAAAVA